MTTDDLLVLPTDAALFWNRAVSAMWRACLLISACKVGVTLIWCAIKGYGVSLEFWHNIVPYFSLGVPPEKFHRLVTLSSWLGVVGVILALLHAIWKTRRDNRRLTASLEDVFDPDATAFFVTAARKGLWLGTWLGTLTLLMTVILELVRDRWIDDYIWARPHIFILSVAGSPVLVLLSMWFSKYLGQYSKLQVNLQNSSDLTTP